MTVIYPSSDWTKSRSPNTILYLNVFFLQGENSYAKIRTWQQNSIKGFLVKPIGYVVLFDVFLKPRFLNSYFQLHEDHGHIKSKDQSNP
jgi:hypothetical protein